MGEISSEHSIEPLQVDNLRHILWSGFLIIALFFGGLTVWSVAAKLGSAIIAQGMIKVDLNRKTVQHREGGIVHEILVREGDKVVAGQPLVVLSDTLVDANAALMNNQLDLMLVKLARLDAQRQAKMSIVWPEELQAREQVPEVRQAMVSEANILREERQALEGQIHLLQQQIIGMQAQVQAEERIINAYQEEFTAKSELQRNRYLEKTPILDLQRSMATHQAIKSVTQQRIHETNLRISEMRRDYVQKGVTQHADMQNKIVEVRERLRPSLDAQKRLVVSAPVGGTVMDMTVFTIGAVIRPGERFMDIVPEDQPLIVEADIPVKDITKIHVGQLAKIQIGSYSPSEVPPLAGKVTYVSPDRTTSRGQGAEMPSYKIHAVITDENLERYKVDLSAGMPATVFVLTKDKTIVSYLLDPITQRLGQAVRE